MIANTQQRINDDQIVDYCEYLWSQADKRQGAVILLSNDQNCCLKCELQGSSRGDLLDLFYS